MTDLATAWRPFEPGIEKRFFVADDGGSTWSIVAADRDHAIALLRAQGASWEVGSDCELGEVDINTAILLGAVELREMRADEVARRKRCHTEDERGVIPLSEAAIGDLFCSEW